MTLLKLPGQVDEDGQEHWSARELMPMLGYESKWDYFKDVVVRASVAIEAQDIAAGQHITSGQSSHKAMAGFGERTYTREDFRLTRYGAYHVALSGDPRKPEVAAAIRYFVVKTREAEIVQHQIPHITKPRITAGLGRWISRGTLWRVQGQLTRFVHHLNVVVNLHVPYWGRAVQPGEDGPVHPTGVVGERASVDEPPRFSGLCVGQSACVEPSPLVDRQL